MYKQEIVVDQNKITEISQIEQNVKVRIEQQEVNKVEEKKKVANENINQICQKSIDKDCEQMAKPQQKQIIKQNNEVLLLKQTQTNAYSMEIAVIRDQKSNEIDSQQKAIQSINLEEKVIKNCSQQLISPLRRFQLNRQSEAGQKENVLNVENYNKILMSIHSSKSQVGYLEEQEDKQLNKNEYFEIKERQQQIKAIQIPELIKDLKDQEQFLKVDIKQLNIKQMEINQTDIKKQNQQKGTKIQNIIKIEKEQKQQMINKQKNQNFRVTIFSEQAVCDNIKNHNDLDNRKSFVENQLLTHQRKLGLVQNLNVTISVNSANKTQNYLKPILLQAAEAKSEIEGGNKKQQIKIQPLDIKSLSVLTLSSPLGIDSIKPPSPKVEGERKAKPWQKVSKMKSTQESMVKNQAISSVSENISIIPSSSFSMPPKIQNEVQKELVNDTGLPVSAAAAGINAILDSNSKNEQRIQIGPNPLSTKFESKLGKIQSKQQYQELKQKYTYLKSIIPANVKTESVIQKLPQQREKNKNSTTLNSDKQQSDLKIQKQETKIDHVENSCTVRQLNLQPHLTLHHPLQNKHIHSEKQKEDGLANSQVFQGEKNNKKGLFQDQISENIPESKQVKQSQNFQLKYEPEKPLQKQEQQQLIKDQSSERKSQGSQIINDESFQDKKSKKSQSKVQLKRRLQELQQKIQRQKQINKQLQIQSSLISKIGISLSASLLIGGMTYVLRRDKLGSLVFALAIGVSTFILKK